MDQDIEDTNPLNPLRATQSILLSSCKHVVQQVLRWWLNAAAAVWEMYQIVKNT